MNEPQLQLGTWMSAGSPVVAELAACCGLSWVLFDLEHGNASEAALPDQLRALRGSATRGIVRVGAPQADLIARVLDWGAAGIMVPHVESAEAAEAIVQAACYPPRGKRGFSRGVRAYQYGLNPPGDPPPRPLLIAQLETAGAVERAGEIAAVPEIDVLFVGPADLQHDLKHRSGAPTYADCLAAVVKAARDAGKAAGLLLRDFADLPAHRALGFTFIAIDSDLAILRKAYQQIVTAAHS